MPDSYFAGQTLDDVMRDIIQAILSQGIRANPTKGAITELMGVLVEISNPRARLSRTETRGKLFSCLGELCWYLAKTNDLGFISYYGPRLFCYKGQNQVANVIDLLGRKQESRQAVIQLFSADDIAEQHKDVPCTCTLQFMIRQGALHMISYMRSNDVYLGLPHDIFSFTLFQEILARTLSVELGTYKHAVGSIHLYDINREKAEQFLNEGWQSTVSMPAMPIGDPWAAIQVLLEAEATIRVQGALHVAEFKDLDPYWVDFIRLLQIFRFSKDKELEKAQHIRNTMSSNIYNPFIDQRLR